MSNQRLLFQKEGRARYISHLDLMRTFQRAFLRAGIEIRHTEGFNPHAFVSIALPLSVGYSSACEILEFGLISPIDMVAVPDRLNAALPEGIHIRACYDGLRPIKQLTHLDWTVTMEYDGGTPGGAAEALRELLSRDSLMVDKKSKKAKTGFTQVDVIPMVKSYEVETGDRKMMLNGVFAAQNPGLNPELIVAALRRDYPAYAPDFVRCHRNETLNADGTVFR